MEYSDSSDRKDERCVLSIIMITFQITTAVCLYKQETFFPHTPKNQYSATEEKEFSGSSPHTPPSGSELSICVDPENLNQEGAASWLIMWPFLRKNGKTMFPRWVGSEAGGSFKVCANPTKRKPRLVSSIPALPELQRRLGGSSLWKDSENTG